MARSEKKGAAGRGGFVTAVRYTFWIATSCVLLGGVIYAAEQFQQFLVSDARFIVPGPPDYGQESPNLHVEGEHYASRAHILRVFDADFGRSLYLFPPAKRRAQLLRVPWVKDATVARVWPNQVRVRIEERKPVAFLEMHNEAIARWMLIDAEGVILDPPPRAVFRLPVVTGVLPGEPQQMRGVRVRRMMNMLADLGPLANKVSEVDVKDLDNLKVTEQMQDRAIVLTLGDRNFRARVQSFLDNYPDIHRRMPNATMLDLRLDDRITAVRSEAN